MDVTYAQIYEGLVGTKIEGVECNIYLLRDVVFVYALTRDTSRLARIIDLFEREARFIRMWPWGRGVIIIFGNREPLGIELALAKLEFMYLELEREEELKGGEEE